MTEPISADTPVQDMIARYPETIRVLVARRLHCAGCYISPFHTLTDTAREYALAVEPLLAELNQAVHEAGHGR